MATLHLLTSSYNGKLGSTYGTSQYGGKYVKAVPFSHAPHNSTQHNCVRAFEILNRVSSAIAKNFFSYLPLNTKKMSAMNAVAHFLKPLIVNHAYEPENITQVFGTYPSFEVTSKVKHEEDGYYTFTINNLANQATYQSSHYCIIITSEFGDLKGIATTDGNSFTLNVPYINTQGSSDIILVLRTVKKLNKFYPFFAVADSDVLKIIANKIMYCTRFPHPEDFALSDHTLTATTRCFSQLTGNTLKIVET